MNEDFGGPNYWSANHDQGFARGGSQYMHQGRAPQDYQPGGGAYGRGFGAAPNGPPRDYAHFASQAPYGQPSGFYHPQHQQMSRNGPTGRGGGHQRFNPNAATFTPMNFVPVQDAYSAGYSNSPVYGMSFGGPNNDPHRFYNPQAQQMPWQQQEWNEYGEEDAAYDQMYSVPEQHNRYVPTAELQQKMYESPCVGILQEIQVGLEQLITENDEYDIWAGAIRDRFVDRAITAAGQRIAVEAIMISQQGVQYSFARLLASLAKSASNLLSDAVLPTLKTFHDRRASLQPEQLTNLLLFTAECYDKLETKGGQSVDILRTALSEQVDSVLKPTSISDNVMKTVIQVIKLTGRYFDRNAEGREDMDGLLTKVNAFARGHPQLSESIKSQVSYLNELRASNWGYREKVEVQSPTSASSSGLYIGPDGKPLSEDERKFLEEHFGQLDMGEPNETNESFDEADAQEEYEDFLRQEQTRSLNKAQEQLEKLSVATNEGKQEETKQEKREEPPAADKDDATA